MSTEQPKASLERALGAVPKRLRSSLIKVYSGLKSASLEGQHDLVGLRAGKLAEVLVRVLQEMLTGSHTLLGDRLGNFKAECEKLERTPKTSGPDSLRILLPRALSFLYTLRNKRDVGHVGGDVEANEIDALTATRVADWCLSELIRVSHSLPLEDAQALCDAIAERQVPKIWNVLGRRRVLDTSLTYRHQTLLLLYSEIDIAVPTEDLFAWTEHSHKGVYRRDVLRKLHLSRLIEWDRETEMAIISPTGIEEVEKRVLPKLASAD